MDERTFHTAAGLTRVLSEIRDGVTSGRMSRDEANALTREVGVWLSRRKGLLAAAKVWDVRAVQFLNILEGRVENPYGGRLGVEIDDFLGDESNR